MKTQPCGLLWISTITTPSPCLAVFRRMLCTPARQSIGSISNTRGSGEHSGRRTIICLSRRFKPPGGCRARNRYCTGWKARPVSVAVVFFTPLAYFFVLSVYHAVETARARCAHNVFPVATAAAAVVLKSVRRFYWFMLFAVLWLDKALPVVAFSVSARPYCSAVRVFVRVPVPTTACLLTRCRCLRSSYATTQRHIMLSSAEFKIGAPHSSQ